MPRQKPLLTADALSDLHKAKQQIVDARLRTKREMRIFLLQSFQGVAISGLFYGPRLRESTPLAQAPSSRERISSSLFPIRRAAACDSHRATKNILFVINNLQKEMG